MTVRYTRTALGQLDRILAYIEQQSPQGARQVQDRLRAVEDLLQQYSRSGGETSRPRMRRFVAVPLPYAVFYRIGDGEIVVHGIRHTSRRPL